MRKKRTHKGTKRADLSALKEVLRDQRVWCSLGIVLKSDDGGPHFEVIDGEVLVDVEIQPSLEELAVLVASPVGGQGTGIFSVPPVGSEVIVALPDGEVEFQPTIVGIMNSGTEAQGLSDSTLVIVAPQGGEVLIHDGDNAVEPLIRKSDYDALIQHIDTHLHPTPMGPSSQPTVPSPTTDGTTVLKGK